MALTLRALAADRPLGLRVLTGDDGLDRPIGWVHPTELTDPQAFLEGGELLLTTGLALDEETSPAYVRRLVEAAVAGLGFGVGLSHDSVPRSLLSTAAEVGLPVLEVPRETPFIALTRAVSRAVAADEYATTVRIGHAQQELTRTAVGKGGPAGVLRKLAKLVDGWALLFERTTVTEAAPASARAYGASLREELERLRTGTRVIALDGEEVVLQTLDTGTRRVLAVGTATPLDTAGRHIVNTAVSVLSLALEQDRAQAAARQALRAGLLELLVGGQAELALRVLAEAGGEPPRAPWSVLVFLGSPAARRRLLAALESEPVFAARRGSSVVAVGADDATGPVTEAALRIGGLHGGVAGPVSPADFPAGLEQAELAAQAALAEDKILVSAAEHTGRGLLSLIEPSVAQAFARGVLTPLRKHDETGRGDLLGSLRCWLEHHGHWDIAAARLGVHRHTLRNRIRKAEELLGRDLDSPGVRAELWVALQA
ncbi:PucR family transcriptional regulator [Amycolatopsis sp. cmx-4-68]|uniref:PucR family transcriptional regulator n=1 Tax=Amycolatopsis sp. cmx-4-68 TaxID=2790938 RepID=UPI003979859F